MNKRKTGASYEETACEFLHRNGMRIVEQNYTTKLGEIDIIARDKDYLVFVEVKYRASDKYGGAFFAIPLKKQRTIAKVAMIYLKAHGYKPQTPCRFDAVLITGEELTYIKNAWQCAY